MSMGGRSGETSAQNNGDDPAAPRRRSSSMRDRWVVGALLLYLLVVASVVVIDAYRSWPHTGVLGHGTANETTIELGPSVNVSGKVRVSSFDGEEEYVVPYSAVFFKLAFLGGAIGGLLYALRYIAYYVGSNNWRSSWWVWYLAHPLVGGLLGLVATAMLHGGADLAARLVDGSVPSVPLAVLGVASLAGYNHYDVMAWMTEKAGTYFPSKRTGTQREMPIVEHASVESDANGDGTLYVSGDGFTGDTVVLLDDQAVKEAKHLSEKLIRVPVKSGSAYRSITVIEPDRPSRRIPYPKR